MKKLILIYVIMTLPTILLSQIRMRISEIIINPTEMTNRSDGSCVLMKCTVFNDSRDATRIFDNCNYQICYFYKGNYHRLHHITTGHDIIGNVKIPPQSSYELMIPFRYADEVEYDSIVPIFFEILSSLTVTIMDEQKGILREIKSDKLNWSQIIIKTDPYTVIRPKD